MAYTNYEIHSGYSEHSSGHGSWACSSGTDFTFIDLAPADANDSNYVYTSTYNTSVYYTVDAFSRNPYIYECMILRVRAKKTTGTGYIIFSTNNGSNTSIELTTSFADYLVPVPVGNRNGWTTPMTQPPWMTNSAYRLEVNSFVTGGAQIQISALQMCTIPVADQGIIIPNGDGSNEEWTLSTGTDSYALIDNFTGLGSSDWTGGNDDTTDYISSAIDFEVTDVDLETPSFEPVSGEPMWAVYYAQVTSGIDQYNPLQTELIESGTAITTTRCGYGAIYNTNEKVDSSYASWITNSFTLDSTPSNWANVQLRITGGDMGNDGNTLAVYGVAVFGPFAYSPSVNYDVSITEAITVGDTQAGIMATFQAIAESITVGDTQSGLAGGLGVFAEGITVGDAQTALGAALGSVSESVLLTDLLSGLQLFLVSISEGISVGDTQSSVASALAALSESITVGDTQTALAGALAALTEGVVTGDTQSGLATALAILAAENVNLNEVLTSLQVFLAYMTESITVGDSVSAQAAVLAAFTESLAAGDAPSATATALAALSEGITNAEVFAAVAAAYASVNEGILVGETWSYPLIGAHLVGTFSIEPLLAASPSNQALLAATVTTEGLEGTTITINR